MGKMVDTRRGVETITKTGKNRLGCDNDRISIHLHYPLKLTEHQVYKMSIPCLIKAVITQDNLHYVIKLKKQCLAGTIASSMS